MNLNRHTQVGDSSSRMRGGAGGMNDHQAPMLGESDAMRAFAFSAMVIAGVQALANAIAIAFEHIQFFDVFMVVFRYAASGNHAHEHRGGACRCVGEQALGGDARANALPGALVFAHKGKTGSRGDCCLQICQRLQNTLFDFGRWRAGRGEHGERAIDPLKLGKFFTMFGAAVFQVAGEACTIVSAQGAERQSRQEIF